MMNRYRLVVGGMAMWAISSSALTLFSSTDAGAEAWSWGSAKVKTHSEGLRIQEANPSGDYGDAFLSDKLPVVQRGRLDISVRPQTGAVTVQMILFKGNSPLSTLDLVKNEAEEQTNTFEFDALQIPSGAETFVVKVWVAGAEAASAIIADLRYSVEETDLVYRLPQKPSVSLVEGVMIEAASPGLMIRSPQGRGSFLLNATADLQKSRSVLYRLEHTTLGRVSVQILYFSDSGNYLGDENLHNDVGDGWYSVDVKTLQVPEGTAKIDFKLWVNGQAGARSVLQQFLVFP